MGIPEREEHEQGIENLPEEIMTKNFPNLKKEKVTQAQETQRILNKLDPKRPTSRNIIIKITRLKDKERILKATREMQVVTHKGVPIKVIDFSTEMFQARREWHKIFKVMISKDLQPRLLYPTRLSFKIEGEIRSFLDKKKPKDFVNTKTLWQQM